MNPLDQLIMNLAIHLTHTTDLPRDQAEQHIGDLVARAEATPARPTTTMSWAFCAG